MPSGATGSLSWRAARPPRMAYIVCPIIPLISDRFRMALRFRHGSRSRIWNLHRTPVPRSNRPTHSFVGVAGELGYAGRPQPKSLPPGLFACSQFPDDHSERARACRVGNGCDWGGSRHWGWGWTLCWPVAPVQRPGPRSGNRHLLAGPSRASCCSCSGRRLTRTVGT